MQIYKNRIETSRNLMAQVQLKLCCIWPFEVQRSYKIFEEWALICSSNVSSNAAEFLKPIATRQIRSWNSKALMQLKLRCIWACEVLGATLMITIWEVIHVHMMPKCQLKCSWNWASRFATRQNSQLKLTSSNAAEFEMPFPAKFCANFMITNWAWITLDKTHNWNSQA